MSDNGTKTASSRNPSACGSGRKKSPLDHRKIPAEVRLNFHREVPLERLKTAIPKPDGGIPPTYMPKWKEIPLDAKLPRLKLPDSLVVLARGNVGERLYHNPKYYNLYDPYNQERVINEEYNALHDPHAKNYLKKPSVQKHLMRQGLITPKGQVLCKSKEFNTYRKYLSTLYHDDILNTLKEQHMKEVARHKSEMELKLNFERTEGVNVRKLQSAKIRQRKIYEERVQKIEERQENAQAREEKLKLDILEKRFAKQMMAFEVDEARKLRVAELKQKVQEKQAAAYSLQVYKENMICERIRREKTAVAEDKHDFMVNRMLKIWQYQEEKLRQDTAIKETIQCDFIKRAKKRQRAVEHYRSMLPQIVQKHRDAVTRLWNLVRKFFNRWVTKVRERKARMPDAGHQSLWEITTNFNETVKYLQHESGYVGLDTVITDIIKLKRRIKEELEREAALEALEEAEEGFAFDEDENHAHEDEPRKSHTNPSSTSQK